MKTLRGPSRKSALSGGSSWTLVASLSRALPARFAGSVRVGRGQVSQSNEIRSIRKVKAPVVIGRDTGRRLGRLPVPRGPRERDGSDAIRGLADP